MALRGERGRCRCQLQGLRMSLGCSPGDRTEQNHPEAGRRTGGDLGLPPRHPGLSCRLSEQDHTRGTLTTLQRGSRADPRAHPGFTDNPGRACSSRVRPVAGGPHSTARARSPSPDPGDTGSSQSLYHETVWFAALPPPLLRAPCSSPRSPLGIPWTPECPWSPQNPAWPAASPDPTAVPEHHVAAEGRSVWFWGGDLGLLLHFLWGEPGGGAGIVRDSEP